MINAEDTSCDSTYYVYIGANSAATDPMRVRAAIIKSEELRSKMSWLGALPESPTSRNPFQRSCLRKDGYVYSCSGTGYLVPLVYRR